MARLVKTCLLPLCLLALLLSSLGAARAERGTPASAEFGIGATIYPDGPYLTQALELAARLQPDWIQLPISWADSQPAADQPPSFDKYAAVLETARQQQISVLVSISDPPPWARTAQGPDPLPAARLVASLARQHPDALRAVELFPGANTSAGWGAAPDAGAYLRMFQTVDARLRAEGQPLLLVAGGLRAAVPAGGADVEDTRYLEELYRLGGAAVLPVISLQFHQLRGMPVDFPGRDAGQVLRHYEMIRRVMIANGHHSGLIWITRFQPPSGKISEPDSASQRLYEQTSWMSLAYVQLRAQLYIGVVIGQSLNPEAGGTGVGAPSLIRDNGEYHPLVSALAEMISLNQTGSVSIMPGKPKEGSLAKQRP